MQQRSGIFAGSLKVQPRLCALVYVKLQCMSDPGPNTVASLADKAIIASINDTDHWSCEALCVVTGAQPHLEERRFCHFQMMTEVTEDSWPPTLLTWLAPR